MEEPPDFPTTVQLTLTRSGSFGAALITWVITPINTDLSDTGTNTGTVTFPSGSNTTQLEIFIFPDNEPEIDELFTVTLVAVTPSSQRISAELVCIEVTSFSVAVAVEKQHRFFVDNVMLGDNLPTFRLDALVILEAKVP